MIVVIPCGGKKRPGRHRAFRLYTGVYFRESLAAALKLAPKDRIFILSGKHGLLPLDQEVDSYEQRIDAPGAITAPEVHAQAERLGILAEPDVVVLAGSVYAGIAKTVWPQCRLPCLGLPGSLGGQRRLFREIANTGRLP